MTMRGDFPGNPFELAARTLALNGRLGADRIYTAPTLAATIAAAASVVSPSSGGPVTVQFYKRCRVLAMYGQELAGTTAKFAATEVSIVIGNKPLITDGQAATFAPLLSLFGPNVNWFPLNKIGQRGVDWTISWRSRDTAATAFPFLALSVIEDPE